MTDTVYNGTLINDLVTLVDIQRWNQTPLERELITTMSTKDSSSSPTPTTIRPKRGERGTGTTITIDLTDQPELLSDIKSAAKTDDREPSKWLRRRLIQLGKNLFDTDKADAS